MGDLLKNKPLRVLLLTNSLILVSGGLLGPIYALFVEEIGGDLLDAGVTGAAFALAAGVTVLLSGKYCDSTRYPARIVGFGYGIMALGYFLFLSVHSMLALLGVQVLIGIGEALYLPAFDALYSRHLDGEEEGEEWGIWEAMNYFCVALGGIAGGFLAQEYGFPVLFILMGILCTGSALYVFFHAKRRFLQ